jgi:hypothetical protein
MNRIGLTICGIILAVLSSLVVAQTDREVQAHKMVLDLAGAFSNEGFKMRDGHWTGPLKQKENALVAVNLYAGNQYWFSVGAVEPAKKIQVTVYDETGNRVTTDNYSDGDKAAAGFTPANSGQYYVSVGLVEGGDSTFCLVYSYK